MKPFRNSKTIQARARDGSFRKWTGDDVGIGVCPECSHLTVQPPAPGASEKGMLAPEDFRRWSRARVCGRCGWRNEDAKLLPVEPAATEEEPKGPPPISPLRAMIEELKNAKP